LLISFIAQNVSIDAFAGSGIVRNSRIKRPKANDEKRKHRDKPEIIHISSIMNFVQRQSFSTCPIPDFIFGELEPLQLIGERVLTKQLKK
jgi:hypothetical protein